LTKAALDYGRLGWSVIPIESCGDRPLLSWQVYQHRRPDPTEIAEWFRRWPDANIAIVTGVVSGLLVVDMDLRHGADATLATWERKYGPIPETVEALTGAGGRHLYFSHPGDMLHNRAGIAPGVDLNGDGGYVVAPPSTHAGGEPYRWVRSPDVCPLAKLPDWLKELSDGEIQSEQPSRNLRLLLREGVADDDRGPAVAYLAGHLLGRGVDPEIAAELLLTWNMARCRPPLEPEKVVRTVEATAHRVRAVE
jgi:hypothetical protein